MIATKKLRHFLIFGIDEAMPSMSLVKTAAREYARPTGRLGEASLPSKNLRKSAKSADEKMLFLKSGGHLFVGELRNIGALAGMFDGDAQNIPGLVHIQKRVLIQVAGLGHLGGLEFDVQRIGVLEIAYFHGLNVRSKNAL